MDIFDLDDALTDGGKRGLEDLLLRALREKFDDHWKCIAAEFNEREQLYEKYSETDAPEDLEAFNEKTQEWSWECESRQDLMLILGAIVTDGGNGSSFGTLVDTIQEVFNRRGEWAFANSGGSRQLALPPHDRAGSRNRGGRRPIYPWQDFCAEMTRRCLERHITSQAELERHMKEWCNEHWSGEPSESLIRDWVAPTYRAINGVEEAGNRPA